MSKHVGLILAALAAVTLAAQDAAIDITTDQVSIAPKARPVSTDQVAIPGMFSYQGKLLDSMGIPVPDTVWQVRFCLYTEPVGGTPYWSEVQEVETHEGLFHVLLGSADPIPSVPDIGELFLGMKVGSDPEMEPRVRIVSAAYSFLAGTADSALRAGEARPVGPAGGGLAGDYPDPAIADDAVTMAKIDQSGAAPGQVIKWTGSDWAPQNDSVGGGGGTGTVTEVIQATGIICTPNPITTAGTVAFDSSYGDGRYVNAEDPNSVSGAMIATPCELVDSLTQPVLRVANYGTGAALRAEGGWRGLVVEGSGADGVHIAAGRTDGVHIEGVDSCGVRVDSAWTGLRVGATRVGVQVDLALEGVRIGQATNYGILIDTSWIGVFVDTASTVAFYANRVRTGLQVDYAINWGVYVEEAGADGFCVDEAAECGLNVGSAGQHGVRVDSCGWSGLAVNHPASHGVHVVDAGRHGILVQDAGGNGVRVERADSAGVRVDSAVYGLRVDEAADAGIFIDSTGNYGILIGDCVWGLYALDAGYIGVLSSGEVAGGRFMAGAEAGIGLEAIAYQGISTDTAIRALGKGLATGGWATGFDDGEAPCLVSPERLMVASGSTQLADGTARIDYPYLFRSHTRSDRPVRISLTPHGDPAGVICVSRTDEAGFGVRLKSIPGWTGTEDVQFDWVAYGTLEEPATTQADMEAWNRATRK